MKFGCHALLLGLGVAVIIGVLAVGGAIEGLLLILALIAIQAPLMWLVWKFLPKVDHGDDDAPTRSDK